MGRLPLVPPGGSASSARSPGTAASWCSGARRLREDQVHGVLAKLGIEVTCSDLTRANRLVT